jgi:hypothetical protein
MGLGKAVQVEPIRIGNPVGTLRRRGVGRAGIVINDENSRSASNALRRRFGSFDMGDDNGDTPVTRWGDATIGVAGGGKNRLGSECCWGGLKCRFGGTKSEQRFKSRHTADVSIRR